MMPSSWSARCTGSHGDDPVSAERGDQPAAGAGVCVRKRSGERPPVDARGGDAPHVAGPAWRRYGVAPLSWIRWLGGGCCWYVLLLVADGAGVVECRVAALAVVEDLDEIEDRRAQPGSGRPGVAVEQLAFQRGEEALGDGVVQRIPDRSHGSDEARGVQAAAVGERGVLGGFNWSSQHPEQRGVDGTTTGLGCCGDSKAADAVAWPAAGGAA